jgi:hypothetical protein
MRLELCRRHALHNLQLRALSYLIGFMPTFTLPGGRSQGLLFRQSALLIIDIALLNS